MRTTKIAFDEKESPESVARRIVYAFNVGNTLKIRDKFFKVIGPKSIVVVSPVEGDNYTLVLPLEALPKPPKPVVIVKPQEPPKTAPEPVIEPPCVPLEVVEDKAVKPGQKWKPKDPRRKGTFAVATVDTEYMYSDTGRKVLLSRLSRYERVFEQG